MKLTMCWTAAQASILRMLLAVSLAASMAGCASLVTPVPLDASTATPALQACVDDYAALDAAVDAAGVRDAGAARVAGFAYLRADRFTASLQDRLIAAASEDKPANALTRMGQDTTHNAGPTAHRTALLQRLVQLDLDARRFEIANLPAPIRAQWVGNADGIRNITTLLQRLQSCATVLVAHDAASPQRMAALLARLQVPDSYRTAYRAAGVYAITRYPFAAGVRKLEAERAAVMASDAPPAAGTRRVRYAPANPVNPASTLTPAQLLAMLTPPADDPLQIPAPSPADLTQLLAQFAPHFDIDIASDNDKPGALVWTAGNVSVDTTAPTLYQQVAHTRYGAHNLLQLVYTVWFAARPPASGSTLDLLAGKLDGITWRVTLAPDGTPLVYDTMHACGCYHMFFPTPSAQPRPAPQQGIEWAFVPHSLPALGEQQRVVVRIAPTTHYIDRVSVDTAPVPAQAATPLALRDYHSLRALPLDRSAINVLPDESPARSASGSRSMFNPQGFVDGTDRVERYLFWPMGIARAGSMRQWGHHATAFVGRRHFDDAMLMQERFDFDARHFSPPAP
jgi:hypothetical protein